MMPRPLVTPALACAAALLAACGDAPSASRTGPPASVTALATEAFTASVGVTLPEPLAVRVHDDRGRPVPGVEVRFRLANAPEGSLLAPDRALTDARGEASTRLTLAQLPGSYDITAFAAGVAIPAHFTGVGAVGGAAVISVTPFRPRLRGAGDSVRLRASLVDGAGNPIPTGAVRFTSGDPDALSVDSLGWVKGRRARSIASVAVSAGGRTDSVRVVVSDTGVSPCFGGPAATAMSVGQVLTLDTRAGICLPAGLADYLMVAMHGTSVSSATVALSTVVGGTTAPLGLVASASRVASASSLPDGGFERALREKESAEGPAYAAAARAVVAEARADRPSLRGSIARSVVPSAVRVGDLLTFNVGTGYCTPIIPRGGRVMAVSSRAIVVADTANPAGGFTAEDYQHYAVTFDTLIAPVDEANFGVPFTLDAQPRAIVLFTRVVNELASAPGTYVAGFFYDRDLLPKSQGSASVCPGSNETEMFYMMVPDTGGVAGNRYTRKFVDSVTVGTIGHEYQHLINASRRLYVTQTDAREEVWLNEGLSHVAEELLLYRSAKLTPGMRLDATRISDPLFRDAYAAFAAPNFARLRAYLLAPENNSPFASNDDIETRGATWSFLRFAADQVGGDQQQLWYRLANSTTAGIQNLRAALGRDPLELARAWAIAMGADGLVPALPGTLSQPSWNFRSAWPQWRGPYPLRTRTPFDGSTTTLSLRGTGAAYLRFGTTTREALLDFSTAGAPANQAITVTLMRIR